MDLVIVVDRLLTGFDAPCLSTLFMDRQPMSPQGLIQAFSRTNRLCDETKTYGQIVTFQSPSDFKDAINFALKLYSRGGDGKPISEDWKTVFEQFRISVNTIHALAPTPQDVCMLSRTQKKSFVHNFRMLDRDFAHLKAFSYYDESILDECNFSEEEYENYAAMYKNVVEEISSHKEGDEDISDTPMDDYELVAYNKLRIDFEYIMELLHGVVEFLDQSVNDFDEAEFITRINELKGLINEYASDNPKLSKLLSEVVAEIESDKEKFIGQDIEAFFNRMRYELIDKEIGEFSKKWFLPFEDVKYEVYNFKDGNLANENSLKSKIDYDRYKEMVEKPVPKFTLRREMVEDFKNNLMGEVSSLL